MDDRDPDRHPCIFWIDVVPIVDTEILLCHRVDERVVGVVLDRCGASELDMSVAVTAVFTCAQCNRRVRFEVRDLLPSLQHGDDHRSVIVEARPNRT